MRDSAVFRVGFPGETVSHYVLREHGFSRLSYLVSLCGEPGGGEWRPLAVDSDRRVCMTCHAEACAIKAEVVTPL